MKTTLAIMFAAIALSAPAVNHAQAVPHAAICSPATIAAASHANVAGLPVAACLWHAPTGDFVCSRHDGCNRCDIDGSPCPKVKGR